MNRNIKIAWLLSVLLWTLTDQAWAICDPLTRIRLDGQEDLRELVVQITHATGDSSTIDTYLGTLPCFGDLYVVEGDLLMTEAEVRGHYYQMHAMKEGAGIAPLPRRNDELIVAMHEGQKSFWTEGNRILTYAVDRQSFFDPKDEFEASSTSEAEYQSIANAACKGEPSITVPAFMQDYVQIVQNMCLAAKDWVGLCAGCGIQINYRPERDVDSSLDGLVFKVRKKSTERGIPVSFLASSFFPFEKETRPYLNISNRYFFSHHDKVGLLRHEIGHILGYKHEQLNGPLACQDDMDGNWKPLTNYDEHSVMHYFCAENKAPALKFAISKCDKSGHETLYLGVVNPPCEAVSRPLDSLGVPKKIQVSRIGIFPSVVLSGTTTNTNPSVLAMPQIQENIRGDVPGSTATLINPLQYWNHCISGDSVEGVEALYSMLTRPQYEKWRESDIIPKSIRKKVKVHIFDVPLQYHSDLADAVEEVHIRPGVDNWKTIRKQGENSKPGNQAKCEKTVVFNIKEHHSTHMAGIIASQQNGRGFIGLSPTSKIESYSKLAYEMVNLNPLFSQLRQDAEFRHIILMASKLTYDKSVLEGRYLKIQDNRDLEPEDIHPVTKSIKDSKLLFVTPVGEGQNGKPEFIARNVALAPMNMGLLDNVIVVTACEDCNSNTAQIMSTMNVPSNKDRFLIHLAAPGKDIPGLTLGSGYFSASGSSQSAAYVAGVAAHMYETYPDFYDSAAKVKKRLIVSASPHLNPAAAIIVSGGVVDPSTAFLDPTKTWIRYTSGDNASDYEPIKPVAWCRDSIQLYEPANNNPSMNTFAKTKLVLRLKRMPDVGVGRESTWLYWRQIEDDKAIEGYTVRIQSTRQGMLTNDEGASLVSKPWVLLEDGTSLSLNTVQDIILGGTEGLMVVSDKCPNPSR